MIRPHWSASCFKPSWIAAQTRVLISGQAACFRPMRHTMSKNSTFDVQNPWARRRKVDLAELLDEPWILSEPDAWNYVYTAEAFARTRFGLPRMTLPTRSTHKEPI